MVTHASIPKPAQVRWDASTERTMAATRSETAPARRAVDHTWAPQAGGPTAPRTTGSASNATTLRSTRSHTKR